MWQNQDMKIRMHVQKSKELKFLAHFNNVNLLGLAKVDKYQHLQISTKMVTFISMFVLEETFFIYNHHTKINFSRMENM